MSLTITLEYKDLSNAIRFAFEAGAVPATEDSEAGSSWVIDRVLIEADGHCKVAGEKLRSLELSPPEIERLKANAAGLACKGY